MPPIRRKKDMQSTSPPEKIDEPSETEPLARNKSTSSETFDADDVSQKYHKGRPNEDQFCTFYIARNLLIRSVAFIYLTGFLVAHNQNAYLIGSNGLLPGDQHLAKICKPPESHSWDKSHFSYAYDCFMSEPSLFWFFNFKQHYDVYLSIFQITGLTISAGILVTGKTNGLMLTILWLLYHSIISVGQRWYSFGWESQTLETGFLAIFLVPFFGFYVDYPPSRIIMWLYRWLIFRIMVGAGMIKIRGDECWRDLTCMYWFHETQPIPNPLAWFMHHAPKNFLLAETLINHLVELAVPFLMLLPSVYAVRTAGVLQIGFMVGIFVSGNLAFLNVLTMIPSIACLDDQFFAAIGTRWRRIRGTPEIPKPRKEPASSKQSKALSYLYSNQKAVPFQIVVDFLVFGIIAHLSTPVIRNVLSSQQIMNTSFDKFKIVNTYGAFGSITKERYEIIIEGTTAEELDGSEVWQSYEFRCKPGDVDTRPCQVAPYHYRLDWLMWFAAFGNESWTYHTWFLSLALKMLRNDKVLLNGLLKSIPDGEVKFIRAKRYLYNFGEDTWYVRKAAMWEDWYFKATNLNDLERMLGQYRQTKDWLNSKNHEYSLV